MAAAGATLPSLALGIVFVTLVVLTLGPLAFIYLIRDRSPQPLRSH